MPGDLKYVDLSGDGYVNKVSGSTEDKTVIGCSRPDFEGGFATRLSWKGLKLSVQGTFSHGAQKIWMGEANMFNMAENQNTQSTALKRWTPENPSNKYPSIRYNFYYNDFGDNAVYDASYVKIQNINLEYSLPRHWVDKTRISVMSAYLPLQIMCIPLLLIRVLLRSLSVRMRSKALLSITICIRQREHLISE